MNLSEIDFPVYLLKSKPTVIDKVSCCLSEKYTEDEEGGIVEIRKVQILDDKSLSGTSLASRRLELNSKGIDLVPLRKALFFLGDLIKVAKPSQYFIDSQGKIFNYTKENRASLRSYPITGIFPIGTGGAVIEIDYAHRFKVLHNPDPKLKHAGVLTYKMQKILYGLYEEPFTETWRMI